MYRTNVPPDAQTDASGDLLAYLQGGRFAVVGFTDGATISGTYTVNGGVLTLQPAEPANPAGERRAYRWSIYRERLSLTKLTGPTYFAVEPWWRVRKL